MSHYKERKEKNCLNCNAEVQGKYCHICGQENIEPKETFWALVTHFVYDVMHFDGKFFSTLKYLLAKPGFLSHEYLRGRRASYLHPVKMYVFTSAIFFIIFFTFIANPHDISESMSEVENIGETPKAKHIMDSLNMAIANTTDTAEKEKIKNLLGVLNSLSANPSDSVHNETDSSAGKELGSTKIETGNNDSVNFRLMSNADLPATEREYDSLQQLLPEKERDGWFTRTMKHKAIAASIKYKQDPDRYWEDFMDKFLHSIPMAMFITLPLIALVMQLLYIRKRKEVFYVNHVIFLTHVYIALFICYLVNFGISALHNVSGFALFKWLNVLVGIYIFIYTLWAMKNFYEQGIIKSVLKYFVLLFVAMFLFMIVFSIFALKSAFI